MDRVELRMAQQGSAVKCLVWDLDDTLWNGTLLEGDHVFIADEVRHTVEVLDSRGILQSIASKNDHDLAWSRLSELGVAEYFILPANCLESEVGRYLIYREHNSTFHRTELLLWTTSLQNVQRWLFICPRFVVTPKARLQPCMSSLNSIPRL